MPPTRPLSPHLGIYRWTWPMMMSIAHRLSGLALYGAMAGLVFWLVALAMGGTLLVVVDGVLRHWLGEILLFFVSWAFWHHLFGGIRHLLMDVGFLFYPPTARRAAALQFFAALLVNLALWLGFRP